MKRIIYLLALYLIIFTACDNAKKQNEEEMKDFKTNEEMMTSTGPAINLDDMDAEITPGTDFNLYANGGWMKNHPIPDDKSRFGSFDKLADVGQKQVKVLIEDLAKEDQKEGTNKHKIGLFYAMGMDTDKIEADGFEPIVPELEKIDALESKEDVVKYVAYMHKHEMYPFFNMYADSDSKDSEMVIMQFSQGGLGLPDRDYYLGNDEVSRKLQKGYKKHIQNMFELIGADHLKEVSDKIFFIEKSLAEKSMTRQERRDPHATYNIFSANDIVDLSVNIDWSIYFRNIGMDDPGNINVKQTKFFKHLGFVLENENMDNLKLYLKWNLLRSTASYLSSDFVNERFDFYGKTLSGKKEIQPRWKRVINNTNMALSEAVGELYVAKHFPPEAKERMLKLVANLRAAFAERINNLDWMGDETKEKALVKLNRINVKIGYPDKWRDYSGLEVKDDSYLANVMRSRAFEFDYMINKINKPVDKDQWFMPPQMVNAYYEPSMNEIVFPAAILQPPFFYLNADDAVNYGAIGVVIGHEMTHGFDDQGRKYDMDGNLNDWWSKEDSELFDKKAQVLIDQFNDYYVLDGLKANGVFTLGENIADLGGLCISYTALQKALAENPQEEKIDGFDPYQRFFLAYAHVWAQNIRDEEVRRRTKEDPHSIGRLRVNGPLPNMQEFYDAFGITEEDAMFIPVEERAKIW